MWLQPWCSRSGSSETTKDTNGGGHVINRSLTDTSRDRECSDCRLHACLAANRKHGILQQGLTSSAMLAGQQPTSENQGRLFFVASCHLCLSHKDAPECIAKATADNCVRGSTFPHHWVTVVCICLSQRESNADIQTVVMIKQRFFDTTLSNIAASNREHV